MTIARALKGIAGGLFILSLPVIFGTVGLRWLVSDTGWYQQGFARYGVSDRTGMAPSELARAADRISGYLLLQENSIQMPVKIVPVKIGDETRPLFNEREISHMVDVRHLLGGFYALQTGAAAYAFLYLLFSRLWLRRGYWAGLGSGLRRGGALTLGLFAAIGLLSLLDFDELFLRFHLMSFDNDLWILDPTRDHLIMMFPQGFWYDSAIRLAMAGSAQAVGAILVGTLLSRKG